MDDPRDGKASIFNGATQCSIAGKKGQIEGLGKGTLAAKQSIRPMQFPMQKKTPGSKCK